ncbi:MAG: hypothetical protein VX681_08910 [Myxococcota bacterium]|nr:hypothetical protein [Myxococcota bacterium]
MRAFTFFTVVVLAAGCAGTSSLDGFPLPPRSRETGAVFFVEHQPNDTRSFDQLIAEAMNRAGLRAQHGTRPAGVDYTVRYIDRWYWDMRTYLVDLRIDVADAGTNELIATARSYQTSLAALGQTHRSVIDTCVRVLTEGMDAELGRRAELRASQPSRRKQR